MDSLPPEAAEPRPMTFLAAAGWTLLAVLLYAIGLSIAESLRAGALKDVVTRATCGALAYSLTLFVILRIHEPNGSIRNVLGLRAPPLLSIPLALVAGAGLAGPLAWLDKVLLERFPYSEQEKEAIEQIASVASYDTTAKRVALVVAMVVVMPALDELFFRGALFTPLRKRSRMQTVMMATAAYETLSSSLHIRDMLSLFALSFALSWVRGFAGSSIPAILARMAFFAPQFGPNLVGKEMPPLSKGLLGASTAAAVASLALLAVLGRRRASDEQASDT